MTIATVTAEQLRHALGYLPTGVTVVTTIGAQGEPIGTTVSAVCSVSAEPALLLVCLARSSETLRAIVEHRAFTVNVLAAEQHGVSSNFARSGAAASWNEVEYRPSQGGLPRLTGVLAALECDVYARYDGGDHEIVVGRVLAVDVEPETEPALLHWRGRYGRVEAG